ncbi:MAG TPA: DUF6221 family protein [Intrasporangium sp.]|uniref:DUF6221 family protein n=1 Tax=Intrasporangium sp. TaxID=1925024 RepID=UPI002D78B408|nr:DUF6221 family protein [Intrasporangium sp.]HET7397613.1 DUF6221 family protein [Intrasporangium sp.]
MSDLVLFLEARLDEDEAAARAALGGRAEQVAGGPSAWAETVGSDGQGPVPFSGTGPERLLVECEAKRRIIRDMQEQVSFAHAEADPHRSASAAQMSQGLYHALMVLATVYAGHPDYRDGWRP